MSVIWSGITEEGAVVPVQVTEEGKVVAVGDGPEGEYVKKTGDNMTGNLTLGTDEITLNADGSAEFKERMSIEASAGPLLSLKRNDFEEGVTSNPNSYSIFDIYDRNNLRTARYAADGTIFLGNSTTGSVSGSGNANISLNADGSASFAGGVDLRGYLALNGADSNAQIVASARGAASDFDIYLRGSNKDASQTWGIESNEGSASFASDACGFTSGGELFFTSRGTRYKLVVTGELCTAEPYTREMQLKEKKDQFIADKRETKPAPQDEVTMDIDNSSLRQD